MRKFFIFIIMLSASGALLAQQRVTGTVEDASIGGGLPGVTVFIKGTTDGAVSDIEGNYSVEVTSPQDILVFSFVGYETQEITVGDQSVIDVFLDVDVQSLEEVVVVGYGVQRKKEITGAVASVDSDDILKTSTSDLGTSLQGMMAGVNVQASSGAPGATANIQIRGLGSFSGGAAQPLYIVDGIPYAGNPNIVPEEIESVEVLKDGAAAAIYGTRASNGVILITTKTGKEGEVKVSYSGYAGVQNITSGIPLMNTPDQFYAEEVQERQLTGLQSEKIVLNPGSLDRDTDFVDHILSNNALIHNHNLTLTKGTKDSKMAFITNYFGQDGILMKSGYERLSARLNNTYIKGNFDGFANLSVRGTTRETEPWGVYQNAIFQRPYQPLPVGEGVVEVPYENPQNIGGFANSLTTDNNSNSTDLNAALGLKYEILDGLTYQVRGGGNIVNYEAELWQPRFVVVAGNGEVENLSSRLDAILTRTMNKSTKWTIENILNYTREFGESTITGTLVYTRERSEFRQTAAQKSDFLSNETNVFNAGNVLNSINGYHSANTLTGLMARAQYSYMGKYMASASIRRDGSSNFGPANRYGYFPGVSLGWNISDETFFQGIGTISNFKLRASWAEVGNQSIGSYRYTAEIIQGTNYPFGAENSGYSPTLGAIQRAFANEGIKWETNVARNIGVDLEMMGGQLNMTLDAYYNSKKDMLLQVQLPPSGGTWIPNAGYQTIFQNVGNMVNKGIEFATTYKKFGDINWSLTGTFTKNINTVTKLNEGFSQFSLGGGNPIPVNPRNFNTTFLALNQPVASFLLIETEGTIKTQEELDEYASRVAGTWKMGDLKYVDANGDGAIDDSDRVYMGNGTPDFEIGLSGTADFNGFDLFVQLYYAHGAEIYNGSKAYAYQTGRHKDLYYQWQPANAASDVPSMRRNGSHMNFATWSDQFLENGTYLRVRNIAVGYTIPKVFFNNQIDKLRLYVSVQNPLTITGYSGFDPEIGYSGDIFNRGVDRGNYPVSRRIIGGLQFDF
ncbi:MAG: SusC/RagA family TonB-linked outer membrane protein [Cyclobacteriaceae bacterium]